jgi:STE24 endopeptidase
MHWLAQLFLAAVATSTLAQLWLSYRQSRAVDAHRDRVPAPFAERISADDHRKAADYTIARERVGRIDVLIDVALLMVLTLGGGISFIDELWQQSLPQPWLGTAVILTIFFAQMLIGLPLSLYRTFSLEARFGFNRTTLKVFIVDMVKQLALGLALGVPLLAAILALMIEAGDLWWLYAWGLLTAFTLFIQWAYPAFIAPLFNKFTLLSDETLKARIADLLQRCGFKAQGVYVMDGSLRSSHGNAYFTGFGKTKRVVFFDTLIERLSIEEIEGVLAHELGHYRRHHIRSRMIVSVLTTLAGFAVLGALSAWPEFYSALGVEPPSPHAALLLFMLAAGPFTFWLTPIGAWWSRRHEFEADEFAAEHASSRELATALVKLYRDNASTLTPDALHSAFYDSHPPALVRIAHLQQLRSPADAS